MQTKTSLNTIHGAIAAMFCLLAMPASAQSSVTMFGIVDSAVRLVDNDAVGSATSLISGGNMTSRLGVRGVEDLGGGMSAAFYLEHGILVDTGAQASATQFWDRRATVAIASKELGEVRLGRDYVPTYINWTRYDPFGYVGVAGANNFMSATPVGPVRSAFGTGLNPLIRSSNSVQYLLPGGLGGVEGGIMLAAGEGGLAANAQDKLTAVRLGYTSSAFEVSAAYSRVENELTTAGKFTDAAIGGNVFAAGAKFSGALRVFKYADAKQSTLLLGAVVLVGTSGEVEVSVNRAKFSGRVGATSLDGNQSTQLGLGYVHNLSKRTALYATASLTTNKGKAAAAVPGGPAGLPAGGDSNGYEAGIRHSF